MYEQLGNRYDTLRYIVHILLGNLYAAYGIIVDFGSVVIPRRILRPFYNIFHKLSILLLAVCPIPVGKRYLKVNKHSHLNEDNSPCIGISLLAVCSIPIGERYLTENKKPNATLN